MGLGVQIFLNRVGKTRIADPVQAMRAGGQIATRQLVLALRTGLDPGQAMGNGKVDRPIIAQFEMQAGVMFDTAPIATIERFPPDMKFNAPATG